MSSRAWWEQYAACWSAPPEQRAQALAACVAEDVVYRDRNTAVNGTADLSAYMDGFRQAFPGGRFAIDRVDEHHQRSLAHWRQLGPDEQAHLHGASVAVHGRDGRLVDITGFFLDTPGPEEPTP